MFHRSDKETKTQNPPQTIQNDMEIKKEQIILL